MKMAQASGGLDFGVKDYREVLLFKDAKTLQQFIDKGWEIGGQGTAVATADGKGEGQALPDLGEGGRVVAVGDESS